MTANVATEDDLQWSPINLHRLSAIGGTIDGTRVRAYGYRVLQEGISHSIMHGGDTRPIPNDEQLFVILEKNNGRWEVVRFASEKQASELIKDAKNIKPFDVKA